MPIPVEKIKTLLLDKIVDQISSFHVYGKKDGDGLGYMVTFLDEKGIKEKKAIIIFTNNSIPYLPQEQELQEYRQKMLKAVDTIETIMWQTGFDD